jgi:hypothetical protein
VTFDHPTPATARARRALACTLVLAAALGLGACGGDATGPDPRAGEVIRAVQAFAAADGEEACGLLTEAALERLYGGPEGCIRRSQSFEAGEVKVEKVTIDERGTRATAQARSVGGRDRFTVTLGLVTPPGCPDPCPQAAWRISEVRPAR